MPTFAGFPDGRLSSIRVPDLFFAELLPQIDTLAELKVTLHLFWLLQQRHDALAVSQAELERDGVLLAGLAPDGETARRALDGALRAGLERGSLLALRATSDDQEALWYTVNTERGRRAVRMVAAGEATLPETDTVAEERPLPQKSTVFALYEQNIGPLQPIIAEELREAQQVYPLDWIEDAFRVAARSNVRQWRYVQAILDRWHREGRDEGSTGEQSDPKRYLTGYYAEYERD